ncbi:hypothetical protein AVEN_128380-1, partial [Araneus ventricosus]
SSSFQELFGLASREPGVCVSGPLHQRARHHSAGSVPRLPLVASHREEHSQPISALQSRLCFQARQLKSIAPRKLQQATSLVGDVIRISECLRITLLLSTDASRSQSVNVSCR